MHNAAVAVTATCSELFPTVIRSAVLSYQNQAARVGGIIAPFIVMASAGGASGNLVPFLTFGAASVLASLLIFTLPETLGVPLPDRMEVCCCLIGSADVQFDGSNLNLVDDRTQLGVCAANDSPQQDANSDQHSTKHQVS